MYILIRENYQRRKTERMKKIFSLMFAAVAVAGITSCEESTIEENFSSVEQGKSEPSCIFASIDNGDMTRVAMTDDGALNFAWESTDAITVEVGGTTYTYTCDDAASGKFVCADTPAFEQGAEYTVSFGASEVSMSQTNADNKFATSESLRLEAKFTYAEGEDIALTFNGTLPIITIVKEGVDATYDGSVIFQNGTETYSADGTIVGDKLTANIVIKEKSGERNMVFMLNGTDGLIKDAYSVKSSKAYVAGVRYTADLSNASLEQPVVLGDNIDTNNNGIIENAELDAFFGNLADGIQKDGATWVISGVNVPAQFSNYFTSRKYDFTNISIICPDIVTVEEGEFENCAPLLSVSCPNAIDIKANAFLGCINMTTVDTPKATSVGPSAFQNCHVLTSVNFPDVDGTIGASAFKECHKLASVNLPNATAIDALAFENCKVLTSVSFPKVIRIGANAFSGCAELTSVDFPAVTYIDMQVFKQDWKLTEVRLTTADEISLFYDANNTWQSPFANCASKCNLYLSSANYEDVEIIESTQSWVPTSYNWGGYTWKSITEVK